MKSFFLCFTLLTFFFSANAAEQIGKIDCYTLDRPMSYLVHADIYRSKSGTDDRPSEFVNINLTSYDWNYHVESAPIKIWKNIPHMNDRYFSEHFKSNEVELDAYYDDVGAMSSIVYEGEEYQLACSIDLK